MTVALAGVVIASPDGVAEAWREFTAVRGRVRDWLARLVPFVHGRPVTVALHAADFGVAAESLSVVVCRDWEPEASDARKIEVLHQQVDLLISEVGRLRNDVGEQVSGLRAEVRQAETGLRREHAGLASRVEQRARRSARVDARGLWPVWFGILLTGIPGEMAAVPAVGWTALAVAVGVTGWLGWRVRFRP